MKVQKTSTQPAFQPIEIKITIESEEEFDLFIMLCNNSYNVSNSISSVEDISSDQKGLLEEMLSGIYKTL